MSADDTIETQSGDFSFEEALRGPIAARTRQRFTAVPNGEGIPDGPIAGRTRQQRLRGLQYSNSDLSRRQTTLGENTNQHRQRQAVERGRRTTRNFERSNQRNLSSSGELPFRLLHEYYAMFAFLTDASDDNPPASNYSSNNSSPKNNVSLNFPTAEVSDPVTAFKCPICLEPYWTKKSISTKCGHIFCHDCLVEWLSMANTCPKCRARVDNSMIIRVFP